MSGITLNLISATLGGEQPVGLLAAIRNPANGNLDGPRILIRNDQLNLVVNTADGVPEIRKLIAVRLGLDLTFTWQRSLNNDVNYLYGNDLVIDSAGNVIVAGSLFVSASGFNTPYVVKFNSSGTLQWQRRTTGNAAYSAVAVDPSDNIYAVGTSQFFASNRNDIYAVKYDANGAIQYQRTVGDTGTFRNELAYSVAVPNLYFAVAGEADPANTDGLLWFLNQSDGTSAGASTQRDAAGSGVQQGVSVIKGETSDVLYYAIRSYATLSTASKCVQVLIKWTASGGFVWQRYFEDSGSSNSVFVSDMAMSSDNSAFYVVASTWNQQVQITKWGIDGSLLWQRGVDSPTAQLYDPNIAVDSLDNIYVSFTSFDSSFSGGTRAMVLKVPGSGAGSGNSAALEGVEYDYITTTRTAYTDALLVSTLTRPNAAAAQAEATPAPTNTTGALAITSGPF